LFQTPESVRDLPFVIQNVENGTSKEYYIRSLLEALAFEVYLILKTFSDHFGDMKKLKESRTFRLLIFLFHEKISSV